MIWLSFYLISRMLKRRDPQAYEALRQKMFTLTDPLRRSYRTWVVRLAGFSTMQ